MALLKLEIILQNISTGSSLTSAFLGPIEASEKGKRKMTCSYGGLLCPGGVLGPG